MVILNIQILQVEYIWGWTVGYIQYSPNTNTPRKSNNTFC